MPNLIDLSIPVRHGDGRLGLEVAFSTPYSFETCGWQGSSFSMFAHYATHVDAPNHFIEGAHGIDEAPIGKLMGAAALIPLDDHGAEPRASPPTRWRIAAAMSGAATSSSCAPAGATSTGASRRSGPDGPYLDPSAADWLVERGAKAVVYDFSEEFAVRRPGFRGEDCPIHHRILGAEIYNIEYVHNLGRISAPRCAILALPLKLAGLDGAPARVVAIEGMDFRRSSPSRLDRKNFRRSVRSERPLGPLAAGLLSQPLINHRPLGSADSHSHWGTTMTSGERQGPALEIVQTRDIACRGAA